MATLKNLTHALEGATDAVENFSKVLSKMHLPRPRRSRQVRGKRARNYVRALERERAASLSNSTPAHLQGFGDSRRIRDEAEKTGALAEHRRLNDERAKAARKRGGEA